MNITGRLCHDNTYSGSPFSGLNNSTSTLGCFTLVKGYPGATEYYLSGRSGGSGWYDFGFDASKSWTGATSSIGGNGNHNNMPPYLAVYMWKRVA